MIKENENIAIDCMEEINPIYMELFFEKIKEKIEEFKYFFGVENVKIVIHLLSKIKLDEMAKVKTIQYKDSEVPHWLVRFFNLRGNFYENSRTRYG